MQSVVSEVVFSINAKDRVHQQHSIVPTGAATLCVEQCIERNFSEAVGAYLGLHRIKNGWTSEDADTSIYGFASQLLSDTILP